MGKKVLIAEDSSVIQNLTRKILEQQEYDIESAKNGEEVINLVEKERFDLILMDINMPIIDGMECSKKIRSMDDPGKSGIPIIAITGNARNYSMDEFKSAGINEYLQKPLDFDKLVSLVFEYTS